MRSASRKDRKAQELWALDDVSFEVAEGEVIGIIGRNGAGKSTLLKLLSRLTEPTRGRITVEGKVGSLLEIGTGFHPELTGRDNIYLNGTILGMSRADVSRRFDEIVEFAEIDRFLDTPVKRYSSGMYVRLAFAVAAHLESEILIVDEVLAVGDVAFQRKCLGRMGQVANEGRTVLFVSHNLAAIKPFRVTCLYEVRKRLTDVVLEVGISTPDGIRLATALSSDGGGPLMQLEPGMHEITAELDLALLPHPQYVVDVAMHLLSGLTVDWVERAVQFAALNVAERGADTYPWHTVRGYVRPKARWFAPAPVRK
ncbi:MAG: ATP-binding cassette domain-containing protein [Chloroflexi bacterium]|nr:MAG: ATP-binding cassette domain-containing protein [Chloroflexota bacterium]